MNIWMYRSRGNTTLRILVNLALIGLAVVLYLKKDVIFHRQPKPVAVEPAATPEPTQRPRPTPTPRVKMPEPGDGVVDVVPEFEPEPLPTATPEPTPEVPETVDLIALARQPREWPGHVTLLAATPFTLVINGAAGGKMQVPAGSLVEVRKFNGQALELGFKGAIAVVPVAGTDFETRALAKRKASNPTASPTPPMAAASAPAPTAAPAATPTGMPDPRYLEIEVVRAKKTRDTGNYYNNKKEEISMRVKLRNTDLRLPFTGLKGEIFVFTETSTARGIAKLAIREQFDIEVPARQSMEHETEEIVTIYDTYNTIGGYKYSGWTLLIKGSSGAVIVKKSSAPTFLENIEAMDAMKTGSTYPKGTWVRKGSAK